jgi:hypothetical protein
MWIKSGDHLGEVAGLCARFVAEMGQSAATVDVNGRIATTPSGTTYTFLVADGHWWREQMRVHPNGWTGQPFDVIVERFGL